MKFAAVLVGEPKTGTWFLGVYRGPAVDSRYPITVVLPNDMNREMVIYAHERYVMFSATKQIIPHARLVYFASLPEEYASEKAPDIIRDFFRTGKYLNSDFAFDWS